jgi:hypothetical protein
MLGIVVIGIVSAIAVLGLAGLAHAARFSPAAPNSPMGTTTARVYVQNDRCAALRVQNRAAERRATRPHCRRRHWHAIEHEYHESMYPTVYS